MGRLTDNEKKFWIFTVGRSDGWRPWRLILSSSHDEYAGEDGRDVCYLTAWAFGWIVRMALPLLFQPHRIKHQAVYWDAATIERMGRDWYYETFPREYGFSYDNGFLHLFLGAQTHDSVTTQSWSWFLPWTQWRHVRYSIYDLSGQHVFTEPPGKFLDTYDTMRAAIDECPKRRFLIEDFDGERITVTTHIEEREWHFGEGHFKWLSLFRKPRIQRSLDLRFSAELGPEKGSWKGGALGHSIEMLPGELHEAAMIRYCGQEHRSKSRHFKILFRGSVE